MWKQLCQIMGTVRSNMRKKFRVKRDQMSLTDPCSFPAKHHQADDCILGQCKAMRNIATTF